LKKFLRLETLLFLTKNLIRKDGTQCPSQLECTINWMIKNFFFRATCVTDWKTSSSLRQVITRLRIHHHISIIAHIQCRHITTLSSAKVPAGYPNNQTVESAQGTMGRGKRQELRFISFPFPSCHECFLFLCPQPPYETKRSLHRRETTTIQS